MGLPIVCTEGPLHQASFRDAVLSAYGGRWAISHMPEPRLLDAAHIVMDADEQLGQPVISNGLPLTKIRLRYTPASEPPQSTASLSTVYPRNHPPKFSGF